MKPEIGHNRVAEILKIKDLKWLHKPYMSGSIEVIPDTITGSPTERVKEPVNRKSCNTLCLQFAARRMLNYFSCF